MMLSVWLYRLSGSEMMTVGLIILIAFLINEIMRAIIMRLRGKIVDYAGNPCLTNLEAYNEIKKVNTRCNIIHTIESLITIFLVADSLLFIGVVLK